MCSKDIVTILYLDVTVYLYIILSQEESLVFILEEGQIIWGKKSQHTLH